MEVGVGMLVASAGLKAVGSIMQGESSASAANMQADWALDNAKLSREDAALSRLNADRARAEGYAAEDTQRRGGRMQLGRQAAAIAQSGIVAGSGSALDVATQSATFAELDALNVRYEGLMRGSSFDQQAVQYDREAIGHEREAAIGRYTAKSARQAGYLGAATGVLSSAASYYGGMKPTTGGGYNFSTQGYGDRH